ncbi:sulfite exporter TauE/SafE family protein [Jiella sp. MQZ9-1]|uniref:Probable membrane transporter protein n=1 Tax=Jiella flava TaxID=2816857 RepID=A0A939FX41_9HYPH|nr:sulfite exporter TauE/SafE family protein [Jiella flava]MBO0663593.1 sulfite exporter TauE/SafE family protein [Jiella flava]MCD2472169.1 sulfite exporter TauE/SafE family protein [Jiella flava]
MTAVLPPDLSGGAVALLVAVSFFTSALTAAFALGGGITLIAVLSLVLPVAVLVPVHAVVQLCSNAGRLMVQRRAVAWRVMPPFLLGALAGAWIGAHTVVALPEATLDLVLGAFILIVTFAKIPKVAGVGRLGTALAGLFTTLLAMFVGAAGPVNAALFAKAFPDRQRLVATLAAINASQHALKLVAFFALGVTLSDYAGLIALMAASGFAGTLAGTALLKRLDERLFRLALTVILALLAIDLLRRGAGALLG